MCPACLAESAGNGVQQNKKKIRWARSLFAVDIVRPLFDNPLRGPAAPVVTALLGGTVVFGLILISIDVFRFPS